MKQSFTTRASSIFTWDLNNFMYPTADDDLIDELNKQFGSA